MEQQESSVQIFEGFPLLELPLLVVEKVLTFVTNPFDLKALRRTCHEIKNAIDRNPDILVHLKVTPKDLKDLENLVNNETHIKWSNFHFPPELYYIGCRRHYIETFNQLLSSFATIYVPHIQKLEIDRFDFSNVHHVDLLKKCKNLVSVKVDAMMVKGVEENRLQEILDDHDTISVLEGLKHLDVTVFEFLIHDYQFEFMGKLLQKCTNLSTLGSWGYFPEWEHHPNGGSVHLKYFLWPVLQYLQKRLPILKLMLESVETPADLSQLQLKFLNESMDWQSGKWILDMKGKSDTDCSSLEQLVYSRIKGYSHRAVGWFDEDEFRKSGLSLMKNLSTIYIHHTRDIKLEEGNPFVEALFPKLENLTLIVGNRLGDKTESSQNDYVRLEQVVVEMLLNVCRPNVTRLSLDMDLDHHHQNGSIQLPLVIKNFPNLTHFCIEEWGPTDLHVFAIYSAFPKLRALMLCGRNLSDQGILGDGRDCVGIRALKDLEILKIFSIRSHPKNIFPWPIKENHNITDLSFQSAFSQIPLRRFHFLLKSEMITIDGLRSLLEGPFSQSNLEFSMNTLPRGVNCVEAFESIRDTFKFLDPRSEPANFVIPDIGKWVL